MRDRPALHRSVWALGFVSLCMDMSSEMVHALLPVFLVGGLGVSAFALGLIEGAAEATASLLKIVSGAWSDRWGKRKSLIVVGYGLAALTKPLFPLAQSATLVVVARLVDRVGKGIRGAPRDALVADVTPAAHRGAAYGLRQSLDTAGAFLGPLLAIGLMVGLSFDVRAVFWAACVPALLAVVVLVAFVREPEHVPKAAPAASWSRALRLREFPPAFWRLVVLVLLFTLMRFSEAFLVLRASEAGLATMWLPATLVVMSATYLLTAYPAGRLSDRMSRKALLAAGCLVMAVADGMLAFGPSLPWVFAGIALWGVHMGLTEGLLAALTADHAPENLRGTAFGVVNLARAAMLLPASALAGALWSGAGARMTFLVGAALAIAAAFATSALRPVARGANAAA
jgi:MFS family permease